MFQLWIVLSAVLLAGIDQFTKWLVLSYLQGHQPFVIIPGVFEFNYQSNNGIAFGMFPQYQQAFIILTFIALVLLFIALMTGKLKQYKIVNISGTLIIAGGFGNLIDRVFRHEVTDFIYVKLINFPVFNLADCMVVIGAFILLVFFMFFYKEDTNHKEIKSEKPNNTVKEGPADEIGNADTSAGENGGTA